ncbi:hypothetical protein B0H19DRAFT_296473 [Mycena capillaripes]|nr:hypothetical protein B0H19DRAFT_296473 [Mycena capillaripes]
MGCTSRLCPKLAPSTKIAQKALYQTSSFSILHTISLDASVSMAGILSHMTTTPCSSNTSQSTTRESRGAAVTRYISCWFKTNTTSGAGARAIPGTAGVIDTSRIRPSLIDA